MVPWRLRSGRRGFDIRPSHGDINALLMSTSLTTETRRAVIDALASAGLLWGSTPALSAAAADPEHVFVGEVDRALEKFDDLVRTRVTTVLSSVGALAC